MEVQNQVILLMGITGAGKSTLGNMLLGRRKKNDGPFVVSDRMDSETRECRVETLSINDQMYDIVDTPGIFDTRQHVKPLKEIAKFVHKCAYGVKAIILVLEAKRFTNENWNALNEIRMFLGKDAINNIIVVFSHASNEQIINRNKMQQAWNDPVDSFIREINDRWNVSPSPDSYDIPFFKSIIESRLLEIKELITGIQEIYTTEQLEKNLKKEAEAKRLKEEEDKRKKAAYENNLKRNAIKEVKETYKAKQEELQQIIEEERKEQRKERKRERKRERERERERYQKELERHQKELERQLERQQRRHQRELDRQRDRSEKIEVAKNSCPCPPSTIITKVDKQPVVNDIRPPTVVVPTDKDKDKDKFFAAAAFTTAQVILRLLL